MPQRVRSASAAASAKAQPGPRRTVSSRKRSGLARLADQLHGVADLCGDRGAARRRRRHPAGLSGGQAAAGDARFRRPDREGAQSPVARRCRRLGALQARPRASSTSWSTRRRTPAPTNGRWCRRSPTISSPAAGAARTPRTVFAVGDDKQSIFGFQGAAPHMLAEMAALLRTRRLRRRRRASCARPLCAVVPLDARGARRRRQRFRRRARRARSRLRPTRPTRRSADTSPDTSSCMPRMVRPQGGASRRTGPTPFDAPSAAETALAEQRRRRDRAAHRDRCSPRASACATGEHPDPGAQARRFRRGDEPGAPQCAASRRPAPTASPSRPTSPCSTFSRSPT